jgi:hypothetical protein
MGNSLHELDFKSLAILDGGKANAQLASRLSVVSKDCQDRPGDVKARTVTVKMVFEPVVDQDGFVSDVKMFVGIESKLPAYNSDGYSMGLRRRGNQATFVFNEDSLDNIDQGTLDMGDDD